MFSYIMGILDDVNEDTVTIDNNGIGYEIHMTSSDISGLPSIGQDVKIYTYFQVREDAFTLYGFLDKQTKKLFEMLLSVNSVGPKGALSILSVLSPDDLRYAIVGGDAKLISSAPGIGLKTAQKVILDLKDKIDLAETVENTLNNGAAALTSDTSVKGDVILALTSLGYSSSEALSALKNINITEESDTEEVLKEALKNMAFM
ncbi:MAG: Holliday junction branch migration protein RuvA [Lachnospiraceae bacterium]|nr:Holliday junction branch migration protein RuvA [Lachnospiraceae bacterium]